MRETGEIAAYIGIFVVVFFFLTFVVVLTVIVSRRKILETEKRKHKELMQTVLETKQSQSAKIATDLHNSILPQLTIAALNLESALTDSRKNGESNQKALEQVGQLREIANSIREIAHGLVPKLFSTYGVLKSIEVTVRQLGSEGDRTAVFINDTAFASSLPYTDVHQMLIFNAISEILNNLRKHSQYNGLTVRLESTETELSFTFTHDGIGIDNAEISRLARSRKGMGLASLESLAIALEGQIDYQKGEDISVVLLKLALKPSITPQTKQ